MFRAFQYRRMAGITVALLLGFAWLEYRLVTLQILRHEELTWKATHQTGRVRLLEAWRGEIRDRTGIPLALSFAEITAYADLSVCSNHIAQVAETVAPILGQTENQVICALLAPIWSADSNSPAGGKRAVVLKRHIPLAEWDSITNSLARADFGLGLQTLGQREMALLFRLRHKALFGEREQTRVYPYGQTAAHMLGFVGSRKDDRLQGLRGVEAFCDQVLAGRRGLCVSEQDAAAQELPERRRFYREPVDGYHIVLTLDLALQQTAEHILVETTRKHAPRHASVIMVRPRTGEILAWAVIPSYDPQKPADSPQENWLNHPLSDRVEPGSTFKIITLAAALHEGLVTLDSLLFCERGLWCHYPFKIRDHASYDVLTVRQCLAKSSNIAFAKLALQLGAERFHRNIRNFGFGELAAIPLPFQTAGVLGQPGEWSAEKVARMGFGQGLAVSQLQMIMAASAIANEGVLMRPLLVRRIESAEGRVLRRVPPQAVRRVLPREIAQLVNLAMQEVVAPGGTGARAALEDYTVAAKTGTAQKANNRGYLPGRYYASFIGFFPARDPQLCISVAVDEPQHEYYASAVAVPVFRALAKEAAQLLNIPGDKSKAPAVLAHVQCPEVVAPEWRPAAATFDRLDPQQDLVLAKLDNP